MDHVRTALVLEPADFLPTDETTPTPSLLDDLLAASERLFQKNVATIQCVFQAQYDKVFDETLAKAPADPDWQGMQLLAEDHLRDYKGALHYQAQQLIEEQVRERIDRDLGIQAFVEGKETMQTA